MSDYIISEYSKQKAMKLGVNIKPSKNRNKKIDVFKDGVFLFSIGAIEYLDYPSYIKLFGKRYADGRRRLYRIRHAKNIEKKHSPGWYAAELLW